MHSRYLWTIVFATITATASAQDPNGDVEQATKAAVKKVSPTVVQIVTQGGSDIVVTTPKGPAFRKALGPTTGVVVSEDGYIVSSAYNFSNSPTSIVVAVPGHKEPYVAKSVATDRSRMLTLLKIDVKGLPVPTAVPSKEIHEGQWSIALGRTLDTKRASPPSVSVGIVSAVGRIWGKAIQTDAKISPINYGGPLIDIQGRVQGILIPASPQGEDVTAGIEWYDSGIGFAIPMDDILTRIVPKLKEGKDLKKGLLGIRMKSQDLYSTAPEIADVTRDSAAFKAGLKVGDVITEIEGKPIVRLAQLHHVLGTKYDGDTISLKYRRGKDDILIKSLALVGASAGVTHPFLGLLPMRDDPKLGVEIRWVFPKSPAEKAGLKPGDRIVKFGVAKASTEFSGEVAGRSQFLNWLNTLSPGAEIDLEVHRKEGKEGKTETVKATLDQLPGSFANPEWSVPEKLPAKASMEKALESLETKNKNIKPAKVDFAAKKKVEKGLIKRTTADGEHKYWIYIHEDYDPNIAHSVVVWLHPPGKNTAEDVDTFTTMWDEMCRKYNLILVGPHSDNENGWIPGEADSVIEAVQEVNKNYTVDRQRVVAHGMGVGGQMAIHLGFHNRDWIRGIATSGAVVTTVKDNLPNQRLGFYMAFGELDPLQKSMSEVRTKLLEKRYSIVTREIPNRGREYLEDRQITELARWIDTLDKQ